MNRVPKLDYRVIQDILSSIGGARALTVSILLKYEEYDQIVSLGFCPEDYNDVDSARQSLAATELLRKHEDLPTSFDRRARALESFQLAEEACFLSNNRLRTRNGYAAQLFVAQRKIADLLGGFNPEEWIELSGWGPGVTITLRGRDAHTFNKFRHDGEATKPLALFINRVWCHLFPSWKVEPQLFEGNRVITVPKNAKTERTIAVEPSLNLYLQKGVGSMIRRRMHRYGIDLNDQLVNRSLAQQGSANNELTTVDFSMASDTLSYQLVLDLLPFRWFEVLDLLRSPRGVNGEDLITYEKFSSMGNGFTWELESLIFWALAQAVVPEDHPRKSSISVFGDDVIIPSDCYDEYVALCAHCGFTVNRTKSFSSSYYRESCGGHYWNGIDITPVYVRRYLKGYDILRCHNRLIELATRFGSGLVYDKSFYQVCCYLRSLKPKWPKVPPALGDSGFYSTFDQARPPLHRKYQRGYLIRHFSFVPDVFEDDHIGVLLTRLTTHGDREHRNGVPLPRSGKTRLITSFFPEWSGDLSWVDIRDVYRLP